MDILRTVILRALLCASVVFGGISESSAQEDKPLLARPNVKVGDSWTYRRIDHKTKKELLTFETRVTFVNDATFLMVSSRVGSTGETDVVWSSHWNGMATSFGVYSPDTGIFRFPMSVGDAHRTRFEFTARKREKGGSVHYQYAVKVVGWDNVTVPAGTFRAMKVEASGTYQRGGVSESGTSRRTYWYVPSVRRWVKYASVEARPSGGGHNTGEELVRYSLQ